VTENVRLGVSEQRKLIAHTRHDRKIRKFASVEKIGRIARYGGWMRR
jgi:hypothetical protein